LVTISQVEFRFQCITKTMNCSFVWELSILWQAFSPKYPWKANIADYNESTHDRTILDISILLCCSDIRILNSSGLTPQLDRIKYSSLGFPLSSQGLFPWSSKFNSSR
jgi:hypothetical protein